MKSLTFAAACFVLLCAGCGPQGAAPEAPVSAATPTAPLIQNAPESPEPEQPNPLESEPPEETETPEPEPLETEDHLLFTLEAAVDSGRTLTLEVFGKKRPPEDGWDPNQWGVREVQVWDGDTLLQTILAQEAIDADGVDGIDRGYTDCWSLEEAASVHDMNFDGWDDLDLFGWICNNTIPHYYWLWDSEAGQYRYAFCLQGAQADFETQEIIVEYRSYEPYGSYTRDFYRFDESGALVLDRQEVETFCRSPVDIQPEIH